jgi:ComF family protein
VRFPPFDGIENDRLGVLETAVDSLLNLFLPQSCLACGEALARRRERGICGPCWKRIAALAITPPWCPSCGMPFSAGVEAPYLCGRCILEPPLFSGARSFGVYTAELRSAVHGLKFDGRRDLAKPLARLLESTWRATWSAEDVDRIVPVPLHPRRKRERGFNQAAVLARALGRRLAVPFGEECLVRSRNTGAQVGLSEAERGTNVRGAFGVPGTAAVRGMRILLIDDVYTTGATVASAARALLGAGALRVSVLTLARAVDDL